jgi:murein L,D-transpeptidase YcbB/YkuD
MTGATDPHLDRRQVLGAAAALGLVGVPSAVSAQAFPAFGQAVAEGVAQDAGLSAFYRETGYAPVWTGPDHAVRRSALVSALSRAAEHGLPVARYDLQSLIAAYHNVSSERARGLLEARTSLLFARFASDLSSGLLDPAEIIEQIVRTLPRPDTAELMRGFVRAEPVAYLRNLAPRAPEYARLYRAKIELEAVIAGGGWGPRVQAGSLRPGESGAQVVALRNRLIEMGYMPRVATARYDAAMQRAVQSFQIAHGLEPDGIATSATIQAINVAPEERIKPVVVALERERWLNIPRGDRHIWVNLTDFKARIMDFDRVTFETRSVVGGQASDTQTPEFSHRMTYMELNPDWTIPRSIIARSYWGGLSGGGHRYLEIIDSRGRVVPREAIDFGRYNPRNFPFEVRQPPGPSNPLGRVKFMFPNPWAIYLHDSPARSLFQTVVRTHSSGCVRLNDPDDFAYELLSRQEADPVAFYQRILRSGQQTRVFLDEPVPIHIEYRTAFTSVEGRLNFRNDVYGRDARLFTALERVGVETPARAS